MTSAAPANKRPPLCPPDSENPSASGLGFPQSRAISTGFLDIDERATKRRKVDGTESTTNDAATSPPASADAPAPKYTYPGDLRKKAAPERKPTHRARNPRQVPCTPDALVTPRGGPALVNDRPAGYFPWGVRPSAEDQLSDINVKQGYQDRPPNPPDKELNTARVPLYNAFKHLAGLESLSTVFSIALEAKSKHNMLDSLSAFKPPPRVTLSEPKKKTWIGELADPNVQLKKLSRTIPQGIRGLGLLEQCLQNVVPLSRAIWFVKCVGANEIRTLKRKGTSQALTAGGERAWLKEWTFNIEQFVESVLNQNGQPLWKQNLQYALRLTTRLYLENLLDRDHFLDWIVNTLATTGHDRIPFWLMMAHVFKQDLAKFRKRGRRLAETLLRRFIMLRDSTNVMVQTVVVKLKEAIRGFALHRPQLFLAPDSWPELKPALQSCLRSDNFLESRLLQRLDHVNERSMGANKRHYRAKPDTRDSLVNTLDSATAPFDIDALSQKLFALSTDYSVLVPAISEWATSRYRYGSERVYLACRLLRKWQKTGLRSEEALLEFVGKTHGSPELFDPAALRHFAAELSRSRAFPTSKYLQWLSVRGLPWPKSVLRSEQTDLRNEKYIRQTCKDGSLLLTDLLFSEAEGRHLNLRNSLLGRAGFDTDLEIQTTQRLQSLVRDLMQQAHENLRLSHSTQQITALLKDWNWRVRSALAHGLRGFVVAKVKHQTLLRQQGAPAEVQAAISLQQFELIRTCLEAIGDEAVLADIVGLCSQTYTEDLQAALVLTVHRHARTFSAVGALEPLQTRLVQNYLSLRNVKVTMPLFATALLGLQTAYPTRAGSVKLFQSDLIRGDRSRAIAACSPFSDGIAESLQNAEETFINDFEAVLQSEPSMTEQTMSRLFSLLTERIDKQAVSIDQDLLFTHCQLMARLRLCRKQQGDQLIRNWLVKLLSMNPTGFAQTLVSYLLDVGALSVQALVDAFAGHKMAAPILQHMFPDQPALRRYAVLSKWADFADFHPHQLLNLASQMPRNSSFSMDELCIRIVLKDGDELTRPAQLNLSRYLNGLVGHGPGGDIGATLESMDVLSLPFVRHHLQLNSIHTIAGASLADTIVNAAAKVQAKQGKLLDVSLDLERMERLQMLVDQAFLLFPTNSSPAAKNTAQLVEKLQQFLKFLSSAAGAAQATSPSAFHRQAVASPATPGLGTPTFGSHLIPPSSPMDISSRALPSTIIDYFRILLQLLCLQRPVQLSNRDQTGKTQSHPDHIKILAYVAHIASHTAFMLPAVTFPDNLQLQQRTREVVDFAYDVMATYVDDLTDENRVTCARILKDRLSPSVGANPGALNGEGTSNSIAALRDCQAKTKWLFGSVNTMGSDLPNAAEMGSGLLVTKRASDGKPVANNAGNVATLGLAALNTGLTSSQPTSAFSGITSEWKPRIWEVLECHGRPDGETSLGLGLFGARRPIPVAAIR
ncbi:Mediator of RNA polymerase II transcription subunit 12 [Cyphellophora attinorum]|uniref:Mediator of RNA polymerase II transcription subunit 12 n=1 Tax=Cyphellophora attinorum TaxID=1664694 RepID=A0A0N1HDE0_9EURO|nr:Mediator of RNA polymerase II transcription subunit 12 [Phialophora attinorum]KPI42992.1 Mediator of RNA polymerase II transcription subunit 12 [Phialophora attinorum]